MGNGVIDEPVFITERISYPVWAEVPANSVLLQPYYRDPGVMYLRRRTDSPNTTLDDFDVMPVTWRLA
jgi:hypothetical protein